ncbi:MAG: SRPBCC domain-containing protein [Cyclobacteriaceae bacterium]
MFRRQYQAIAIISAPSSAVWSTLVDTPDYHRWNTFTQKVDLDWAIGSPVKMEVVMNLGRKPIKQTEYLTQYVEGAKIAWGLNWWPLLKAERTQTLSLHKGGCQYETVDTIKGPLTPIVHAIYGQRILAGFERVCEGLKNYAEAKHK